MLRHFIFIVFMVLLALPSSADTLMRETIPSSSNFMEILNLDETTVKATARILKSSKYIGKMSVFDWKSIGFGVGYMVGYTEAKDGALVPMIRKYSDDLGAMILNLGSLPSFRERILDNMDATEMEKAIMDGYNSFKAGKYDTRAILKNLQTHSKGLNIPNVWEYILSNLNNNDPIDQ